MDILLIPFGEAEKQQLARDYPFFDFATIPAGTYRGQDEPFEGLNVGSAHLITNATVDEDLVYDVTKAIYENRDQVAERHAAGKAINEKNAPKNTGTEFHPGAIRFYTEAGIWPGSEAAGADETADDSAASEAPDASVATEAPAAP
jgi:hypothetical protein